MMLGFIGAAVSLVANIVGAPLFGQHPLQLIRVYLTFPMGERALVAEEGLVMTVGCVLYLLTGAVYGVAFHLIMSAMFKNGSVWTRFLAATAIGLGLWVVNFYGILLWVQPILLDGDWIVRLVPWWVAALTHLAFAWTMLLVSFWGTFQPYGSRAATAAAAVLAAGLMLSVSACDREASANPPESPEAAEGVVALTEAAAAPAPTDPKPVEYPNWKTINPGEYTGYNQRASLIQRGKRVYERYCVGCHGPEGDGQGVAAKRLITKPRDFTRGIYKIRTTDSGSLPMESDLYRTIRRGLPNVSMPAFPLMPEHEVVAVVEYIKSFYPDWEKERVQRKTVAVPQAPPAEELADPVRIKRGRVVYLAMQCGKCHGSDGQGTGATQTEYVDAWGNLQRPFDFTRGRLKGGDDPEDIYRTFHTGLRSVMPAFGGVTLASANLATFEEQAPYHLPGEREQLADVLDQFPATGAEVFTKMTPQQRDELALRNSWDLVAYIQSLRRPISTAEAVLGAKPIDWSKRREAELAAEQEAPASVGGIDEEY